jgi:hypothetical protein
MIRILKDFKNISFIWIQNVIVDLVEQVRDYT